MGHLMAIHPIAEIFYSGPKWSTNQLTSIAIPRTMPLNIFNEWPWSLHNYVNMTTRKQNSVSPQQKSLFFQLGRFWIPSSVNLAELTHCLTGNYHQNRFILIRKLHLSVILNRVPDVPMMFFQIPLMKREKKTGTRQQP